MSTIANSLLETLVICETIVQTGCSANARTQKKSNVIQKLTRNVKNEKKVDIAKKKMRHNQSIVCVFAIALALH